MSLWFDNMRARQRAARGARMRQGTWARIADICADIDVRLDRKPGSTFVLVKERLGDGPSYLELQRMSVQLLRWVSLGCPAEWEEAV